MQLPQKLSRAIYLLLLLFLVSSCASIKIDPPGPEVQTILILPYTKINTTGRSAGYIYHYHIVNLGDDSITYEAKFNQSGKEGYLVVNSLPPGNYRVDKVTVNPVGSGGRSYDRSEYPRNEEFKLVTGKITIFQKSIHVSQVKDPTDPGRFFGGFRIDPATPDRRNNILEKLEKQENYDAWRILGLTELIVDQMQGKWTGSWEVTTEVGSNGNSCSNGKVRFEIKENELLGQATSHIGETYDVIASISEAGSIKGNFVVGNQQIARISGGFFMGNSSGGEISGVIEDVANCKSRWEALKE